MNNETIKRICSSIILIPFIFFLIFKGSIYFIILLLVCFFISVYEWYNLTKKKLYFLPGILFLTISFFSTYLLRINDDKNYYSLFILVIIICISTDIGGYVFGKIFKGPKLIKISPNKTYAGMFGSYLLSILSLIVLSNYIYLFNIEKINIDMKLILFVLLVSTVSQLGDLIISYFKRLSKIKNTGKIIPGHGGLLDRIDGMIFAIPFAYLFTFF